MSVQKFTKSLRDKNISIDERTNFAFNVLAGTEPLFLPQKPLVLLEWVFSALSTEPQARKSSQLWKLLIDLWVLCDIDTQIKIVRSYKLANILLDTWKLPLESTTLDLIEQALELIFKSTVLVCTSDQQAGSLVLGYLGHVQDRQTNILPILEKQLQSRSKIFKTSKNVLTVLVGVPNNTHFLIDYLMVADAGVDQCPPSSLGQLVQAIIASHISVGQRFAKLCELHPNKVDILLDNLGQVNIDRDILKSLLDEQINLHNWAALSILLEKIPVEVALRVPQLLDALNSKFDLQFTSQLATKCTQMRKLNEFIIAWCQLSNPKMFSEKMLAVISTCLEQLSQQQLENLLSVLNESGLSHVIPALNFKSSTSPKLREQFLRMLTEENGSVSFAILSLWPTVLTEHPQVVEHVLNLNSPACTLIVTESGASDPKVFAYCISKEKSTPTEAAALIGRFYKILNELDGSEMLVNIVEEQKCAELLQLRDIYEYQCISGALVDHFISQKWDTRPLLNVPQNALSRQQREHILERAWKQKNLELVDKVLEHPPRSTKIESDPRKLLHLGDSLDESDCKLFMSISKKLIRQGTFANELRSLVSSQHNWSHICLASVLPSSNKDSTALVKLLETNLINREHLHSSIVCLLHLTSEGTAQANPAIVGCLLADTPDTSGVFSLLCRSSSDWQAVTAYFIYTECRFTDTFLTYCKSLDPQEIIYLIRECIRRKYYKAVQVLFSAGDLVKEDIIPFITFMVQSVFTDPSDLNEIEMAEFISLVSYLVKSESWVVSQYSLETSIAIVAKVCSGAYTTVTTDAISLFSSLCRMIGHCLLFQRHRLTNRNHLVISALSNLLKCLSGAKLTREQRLKNFGNFPVFFIQGKELGESVLAAESFMRVVSNFCDPPQRSVRENSGKNNLTSSVARVRRYIAKTVGVLVANYATISLQYGFSSKISSIIQQAIFTILDVLSSQELKSTIASVDGAGRSYMKAVHESYNATGKWKKD